MPRITPLQVAMGVGVAGAMVDVSSFVKGTDWFTRSSGRQDEFRDADPGMFSFILENQDGRFTPGNAASVLPTLVTEGTPVCLNIGGRLTAGTVMGFDLMSAEQDWGRIQITCDDMLGNAGRKTLTSGLSAALVSAASPAYFWPLDDSADSLMALEKSGGPSLVPSANGRYAFGVEGIPSIGGTQLQFATVSTPRTLSATVVPTGWFGVWCTPSSSTSGAVLQITFGPTVFVIGPNTAGFWEMDVAGSPVVGPVVTAGVPAYIGMSLVQVGAFPSTTFNATMYVNGVACGTAGPSGAAGTRVATLAIGLTSLNDQASFSHLTQATSGVIHEELVATPSEATRLAALASVAPEITLATLPATLSKAPLGAASSAGQTLLAAMNDVIRTEQGEIYTTTTGTLLNPVQKVAVRSRDRTTTPLYTFDISELDGVPQFVRDIANLVSTVTVTGPNRSVDVTDSTVTGRAGSATAAENVLNETAVDLQAWGQDRIWRGKNIALKSPTLNIDALTTPTDRSADLLAIKQGDRVRITGLPAAALGFSTWDCWIIGVSEKHGLTSHSFAFNTRPVLPATGIFNTDRWQDSNELSLSAGITAGATTMNVATSATYGFTTAGGDFPQTIQVDNEQMTVTAVTAATPQVFTITRGANGTTAATHSLGALVHTVTGSALFAF